MLLKLIIFGLLKFAHAKDPFWCTVEDLPGRFTYNSTPEIRPYSHLDVYQWQVTGCAEDHYMSSRLAAWIESTPPWMPCIPPEEDNGLIHLPTGLDCYKRCSIPKGGDFAFNLKIKSGQYLPYDHPDDATLESIGRMLGMIEDDEIEVTKMTCPVPLYKARSSHNSKTAVCKKGYWDPPLPGCYRSCKIPKFYIGHELSVTIPTAYEGNGYATGHITVTKEVIDTKQYFEGTKFFISNCDEPYYTVLLPAQHVCAKNGHWVPRPRPCPKKCDMPKANSRNGIASVTLNDGKTYDLSDWSASIRRYPGDQIVSVKCSGPDKLYGRALLPSTCSYSGEWRPALGSCTPHCRIQAMPGVEIYASSDYYPGNGSVGLGEAVLYRCAGSKTFTPQVCEDKGGRPTWTADLRCSAEAMLASMAYCLAIVLAFLFQF